MAGMVTAAGADEITETMDADVTGESGPGAITGAATETTGVEITVETEVLAVTETGVVTGTATETGATGAVTV